jgi:hypothetical protein
MGADYTGIGVCVGRLASNVFGLFLEKLQAGLAAKNLLRIMRRSLRWSAGLCGALMGRWLVEVVIYQSVAGFVEFCFKSKRDLKRS